MDHSDGGLARYEMAMQMAIILAEVFQLLKIPFEVTGFNAGYNSNHSNIEYQGNRSVHLRTEKIYYHIFKAFEDDYSIESVKHCLGAINASGYNVDHEVIRWSAARLHRRKENRKLQIILSDGLPCGGELYENELILVNDNIVKAGIEQFAFGLQCECVSKFYSKYTVLEKMEDLNTMALKIFVDFLEAGFQNQFIG
jgi:cobalamin biosynthesis protein CobT